WRSSIGETLKFQFVNFAKTIIEQLRPWMLLRARGDALREIEAPPCRLAGVISWQTIFENVRPHGVDRACRRDADVPQRAAQRSPSHRIRPCLSSTNARGIRSSAVSSSNENRGHSSEKEQHAPQAWHAAASSAAGRVDKSVT